MSKYEWTELLRKWRLEELTEAQAIGQLLLWTEETLKKVKGLQSSVSRLKREKAELVEEVNTLSAQLRMTEEQLEFDAIKRQQRQLVGRVDRLAERLEGLVIRETRRHRS